MEGKDIQKAGCVIAALGFALPFIVLAVAFVFAAIKSMI